MSTLSYQAIVKGAIMFLSEGKKSFGKSDSKKNLDFSNIKCVWGGGGGEVIYVRDYY